MYHRLLVQGLKSGSFEVGGIEGCGKVYFSTGKIMGRRWRGLVIDESGAGIAEIGLEELLLLMMESTRRRFALMAGLTGSYFHKV